MENKKTTPAIVVLNMSKKMEAVTKAMKNLSKAAKQTIILTSAMVPHSIRNLNLSKNPFPQKTELDKAREALIFQHHSFEEFAALRKSMERQQLRKTSRRLYGTLIKLGLL